MIRTLILTLSFSFLAGAAQGKTLFKYKKKEIKPVLAESVNKLSDGKYEIKLKANQQVQGKDLTPELVKQSVEGKLKKSLKTEVTKVDDRTVHITFDGQEETFLKRLSKTRIKARKSVSLALDSSVSDGGIRAKTGKDPASDDEIKIKVTKVTADQVEGIALDIGKNYKSQVKMGRKLRIKAKNTDTFEKGKHAFIKPKKDGKDWVLP
ncbi:hypothetical protein [Pseudobacteriovorax antillogorgiicola]|uniref:Uncharacterized protein n=1 Tax=Pseudobacteriovorax antillogorgiicola TaxID=1513793 RepID=A0A1Y6CIU1_9BACT|nr:hypothetical protein [Pseudobacteriovorax antillogorgiicola]TCS46716.1 hypothetical protein EDD56_12392 [Pseudobacteriovorax antillogorgiicola]SMF67079.1 hypothetical protein SAMN06296036_12392 [Pseudobacteriovorax antillogorgiicola]